MCLCKESFIEVYQNYFLTPCWSCSLKYFLFYVRNSHTFIQPINISSKLHSRHWREEITEKWPQALWMSESQWMRLEKFPQVWAEWFLTSVPVLSCLLPWTLFWVWCVDTWMVRSCTWTFPLIHGWRDLAPEPFVSLHGSDGCRLFFDNGPAPTPAGEDSRLFWTDWHACMLA